MTAEAETQGRKKQFLECATSPVLVRPCWGSLRKINTRNSLSSSFSFLFPRFSLFYEINTANLAVNQTNHTGACPNVRTAPKPGESGWARPPTILSRTPGRISLRAPARPRPPRPRHVAADTTLRPRPVSLRPAPFPAAPHRPVTRRAAAAAPPGSPGIC